MDKLKFISSDTEYLDLAKSITDSLWRLTTFKEDYTLGTILAGISIGTYMFLQHLANNIEGVTAKDLYDNFDDWINWVNEVQEKERVSRCENKVVGETTSEL